MKINIVQDNPNPKLEWENLKENTLYEMDVNDADRTDYVYITHDQIFHLWNGKLSVRRNKVGFVWDYPYAKYTASSDKIIITLG